MESFGSMQPLAPLVNARHAQNSAEPLTPSKPLGQARYRPQALPVKPQGRIEAVAVVVVADPVTVIVDGGAVMVEVAVVTEVEGVPVATREQAELTTVVG